VDLPDAWRLGARHRAHERSALRPGSVRSPRGGAGARAGGDSHGRGDAHPRVRARYSPNRAIRPTALLAQLLEERELLLTALVEQLGHRVLAGEAGAHPREEFVAGEQQHAVVLLDGDQRGAHRPAVALAQCCGQHDATLISHPECCGVTHEGTVPLGLISLSQPGRTRCSLGLARLGGACCQDSLVVEAGVRSRGDYLAAATTALAAFAVGVAVNVVTDTFDGTPWLVVLAVTSAAASALVRVRRLPGSAPLRRVMTTLILLVGAGVVLVSRVLPELWTVAFFITGSLLVLGGSVLAQEPRLRVLTLLWAAICAFVSWGLFLGLSLFLHYGVIAGLFFAGLSAVLFISFAGIILKDPVLEAIGDWAVPIGSGVLGVLLVGSEQVVFGIGVLIGSLAIGLVIAGSNTRTRWLALVGFILQSVAAFVVAASFEFDALTVCVFVAITGAAVTFWATHLNRGGSFVLVLGLVVFLVGIGGMTWRSASDGDWFFVLAVGAAAAAAAIAIWRASPRLRARFRLLSIWLVSEKRGPST